MEVIFGKVKYFPKRDNQQLIKMNKRLKKIQKMSNRLKL